MGEMEDDVVHGPITLEKRLLSLCRLARFNGHTEGRAVSVAEHSFAIAMAMRRDGLSAAWQLVGLLHDLGESTVGDIVSPVKQSLSEESQKWLKSVESRVIWNVVTMVVDGNVDHELVLLWKRIWDNPYPDEVDLLRRYDLGAFYTETMLFCDIGRRAAVGEQYAAYEGVVGELWYYSEDRAVEEVRLMNDLSALLSTIAVDMNSTWLIREVVDMRTTRWQWSE